jgi:hypothetical protein
MGRATQGVRLMDLSGDEKIVSVAKLAERDDASDVREAVPTEAPEEELAPGEAEADPSETDGDGDGGGEPGGEGSE